MSKEQELIRRALLNPAYLWRTIQGIEKETGLSAKVIESILLSDDGVIRSSSVNEKGEQLFAARDAYRKNISPFRRLSSILKNRGD